MIAILKYRNHSSFVAIRSRCKCRTSFSLTGNDRKEIENLILNLDANKLSPSSDIPVKIVKESIDIFRDFLCSKAQIVQ